MAGNFRDTGPVTTNVVGQAADPLEVFRDVIDGDPEVVGLVLEGIHLGLQLHERHAAESERAMFGGPGPGDIRRWAQESAREITQTGRFPRSQEDRHRAGVVANMGLMAFDVLRLRSEKADHR